MCLSVTLFGSRVQHTTAGDLPESLICQCELLGKHLSSVQKRTRGYETFFRMRYEFFSEWTFSTFPDFRDSRLPILKCRFLRKISHPKSDDFFSNGNVPSKSDFSKVQASSHIFFKNVDFWYILIESVEFFRDFLVLDFQKFTSTFETRVRIGPTAR